MDAAADWLLLIAEDPGVRVSEPFERWLHAAPENLRAFAQVSNSWAATAPERLGFFSSLLLLHQRGARLWRSLMPSGAGRRAGFALAGITALVCLALVYVLVPSATLPPAYYSAPTGTVRTVELADKSTLYIESGTDTRVVMARNSRTVELDHGGVFVKVNGRDSRIFKVVSGPTAFVATGTAYSVRTYEGGPRLQVYEGTVEIRRESRLLGAVHAGEGARVDGYALTRFPVHVTPDMPRPDWTRNRINFDTTPLADAVSEFNRYSRKRIVLLGDGLPQESVSGTFALNDVEAFLHSVTIVAGARLRETDTTIYISR